MKSKKIIKQFHSLEELVDFYNEYYSDWVSNEITRCSNIINSNDCDCLKAEYLLACSSHQHYLAYDLENKQKAVKIIRDRKFWQHEFNDFEELYYKVRKSLIDVSNIGDLAVYDVAKRIGGILGIEPEKYVYLASGAKEGAENLLGYKIKDYRLPKEEFDKYFSTLSPIHIENILCILKKYFIKDGIDTTKEYEMKIYK